MLIIDSLRVAYGDFIAVSGASLEAGDGQIAAVIGANGAGKSSLLNTVAGLLPSAGGKVFFRGEDITGMPPEKIVDRGLALVPQGGRCFPRMSVRDNLMVGSYPKRARRDAAATLERVYALFPVLKEKEKDLDGTLSGGQRQMLAIGRALMSKPSCLMFDEISLGLAPIVINDIYALIGRINREEKIGVVLVEQNTERALRISDSCFVMLKGRVVLSGQSAQVSTEAVKAAYFGI